MFYSVSSQKWQSMMKMHKQRKYSCYGPMALPFAIEIHTQFCIRCQLRLNNTMCLCVDRCCFWWNTDDPCLTACRSNFSMYIWNVNHLHILLSHISSFRIIFCFISSREKISLNLKFVGIYDKHRVTLSDIFFCIFAHYQWLNENEH